MEIKLNKEDIDRLIEEYISLKTGGELSLDDIKYVQECQDGPYYVKYDYVLIDVK